MNNKPIHSRRKFLQLAGALSISSTWQALRMAVPFARYIPAGLLPVVAEGAQAAGPLKELGKDDLRLLNDRPVNAETPAYLLDDDITPASRLFVRNNGVPPVSVDPTKWSVKVHGESCERPQTFTLSDLKRRFDSTCLQLQLECGGNGRSEFRPRASGNQWTTGAVGCPQWKGVRLADVLNYCGVSKDAVYVAYRSADTHLSGDANKRPISRGVPIAKAMEVESMLAFEMNGEPIPAIHGAPLRMVVGGWPGSVSGKWVTEVVVLDHEHDGAKMGGSSYRVPCESVAPGTSVPDEGMCIIESMPIKSLITSPRSGIKVDVGTKLAVRGHAWAGDQTVSSVEVSVDFGANWTSATLKAPVNRLAWQHFNTEIQLQKPGYYEVWSRATDEDGNAQPMLVPGWNPKGYLNNACHRIALKVV